MTGLFDRWVKGCPLDYTSLNASEIVDVLGTWLLSILDGQRRYAHITGLRGDAVAPEILGMKRIISDESLRRALKQRAPSIGKGCSEEERARREAQLAKSDTWVDVALKDSIREAQGTDWILDCDTTIKLLFGHQADMVFHLLQGAKINRANTPLQKEIIQPLRMLAAQLIDSTQYELGKYHP